MLSPNQVAYINLGLQNRYKCVFYRKTDENYTVFVNSGACKDKNLPIYTLAFENNQSAINFAQRNMRYDKYKFDVFVDGNGILIEPIMIEGMLKIDCGANEEMAKKIVRRFRKQYIQKLNMFKHTADDKKDFKGMKF